MTTVLEGALLEGVLARMTGPDYRGFEAQLRSSGYCERPVRLRGSIEVCDGHGARREVWSTVGEPDGLLRKACGNRREAVCGPCAERYRGDAWQLVAAGLRGGKGIPESVSGHPAVFGTLTAPSFGAVHAQLLGPDGEALRCRPRRDAPLCPHGTRLACSQIHAPDDSCLGEPLCPDCFDYAGAVVWNNLLGELWRRTMIYLPRQLAALVGMTQQRVHELVRVSYVKVAEYQRRGLVHVHPVIRLDRRMPAYRSAEVHPPDRRFTVQLLDEALRGAVDAVSVPVPDELGAGVVRWGKQLDVQQLTADDEQRRRRASYLAKYSTKSTEQAGGLLHRIHPNDIDTVAVSEHNRRYLRTAFELHDQVSAVIRADEAAECMTAPRPAPAPAPVPVPVSASVLEAAAVPARVAVVRDKRDRRLAACAHTFGYRGHCLTKSRHYSTSFKDLREDRADHVREQLLANGDRKQRELAELADGERITSFEFVGVGHLTTADAYLAAQAAARAREHRELGREALEDQHNRRRQDECETPQDQTRAA